jgi:sodium-coupled neutral amino acid transporter 11
MVAFCVIVGDTIPKVMDALFPSLSDMPFLWLLTDRRAVMILLILGISFPLSLYRDIAKVVTIHAQSNSPADVHSSPRPAGLP